MLIIYALTYTLMPSFTFRNRYSRNLLVFSYIFFFISCFGLIQSRYFQDFSSQYTYKGFVLPQNDSLQSPNSSKKDQDFFKKALCLF